MAETVIRKAPYDKDKRRVIKLVHITGKDSKYPDGEYAVNGPVGGWMTYGTRKDQALAAFKRYTGK